MSRGNISIHVELWREYLDPSTHPYRYSDRSPDSDGADPDTTYLPRARVGGVLLAAKVLRASLHRLVNLGIVAL